MEDKFRDDVKKKRRLKTRRSLWREREGERDLGGINHKSHPQRTRGKNISLTKS